MNTNCKIKNNPNQCLTKSLIYALPFLPILGFLGLRHPLLYLPGFFIGVILYFVCYSAGALLGFLIYKVGTILIKIKRPDLKLYSSPINLAFIFLPVNILWLNMYSCAAIILFELNVSNGGEFEPIWYLGICFIYVPICSLLFGLAGVLILTVRDLESCRNNLTEQESVLSCSIIKKIILTTYLAALAVFGVSMAAGFIPFSNTSHQNFTLVIPDKD